MKPLKVFAACFGLICIASIPSCNKDKTGRRAPVAVAGDIITAQLLSCNDRTGSAELNGSGYFF